MTQIPPVLQERGRSRWEYKALSPLGEAETTSGTRRLEEYRAHGYRIFCRRVDTTDWCELRASDSPASVSPEQTPSPAADSAHSSDQCTVPEATT